MSTLFDLSVPVYIRGLQSLSHILIRGEEWADTNGVSSARLLDASLSPDMRSLPFQVWSACNTAKAIAPRLADIASPCAADDEETFADLQNRIQSTVEFLQTLKPAAFEGNGNTEVVLKFRRELVFPTGLAYLQIYGIPNFWFHITTVYAILRNQGVPLGKPDFIGAV